MKEHIRNNTAVKETDDATQCNNTTEDRNRETVKVGRGGKEIYRAVSLTEKNKSIKEKVSGRKQR